MRGPVRKGRRVAHAGLRGWLLVAAGFQPQTSKPEEGWFIGTVARVSSTRKIKIATDPSVHVPVRPSKREHTTKKR